MVRFRNPEDNDLGRPSVHNLLAFFYRRLMMRNQTIDVPKSHVIPEKKAIAKYNKFAKKNSITWLGHATFLINLGGKVILTDPFLTKVAGPFGIGPKRYVPPGISIKKFT